MNNAVLQGPLRTKIKILFSALNSLLQRGVTSLYFFETVTTVRIAFAFLDCSSQPTTSLGPIQFLSLFSISYRSSTFSGLTYSSSTKFRSQQVPTLLPTPQVSLRYQIWNSVLPDRIIQKIKIHLKKASYVVEQGKLLVYLLDKCPETRLVYVVCECAYGLCVCTYGQ